MNPQIHSFKRGGVSPRNSVPPEASRLPSVFWASSVAVLLAVSAALLSVPAIRGREKQSLDPWTAAQSLQPGELARELADKNETPPTLVYVGFRTLFAGGHIPGATFHGSASTEQGFSDLKKWAEELPRTTNLVIYCGCCPLEKCPNIRPAFTALDKMGFKRLRILVLPTNFATDWADKGYPLQKGM